MHIVRSLFSAFLMLPLLAGSAAATEIVAGRDYQPLMVDQPTDNPGKIEVVEFFAYTCPHCFHFEPILNAWAQKLPKNVVLKRQPVIFSDSWEPMARAFYALQAMNALDRLHDKVFDAIHKDQKPLMNPDAFFDWGAKNGLDRAKLKAAYESFAVNTDVAKAKEMVRAYGITGVPALAVNGKYVTSASMTGSHEKALAVVDELIKKEMPALPAGKSDKKTKH